VLVLVLTVVPVEEVSVDVVEGEEVEMAVEVVVDTLALWGPAGTINASPRARATTAIVPTVCHVFMLTLIQYSPPVILILMARTLRTDRRSCK
jgi:hypothetical protein